VVAKLITKDLEALEDFVSDHVRNVPNVLVNLPKIIPREYKAKTQRPKTKLDKEYEGQGPDPRRVLIEKKDGTGIGYVAHFLAVKKHPTIGFALITGERAKGCGSEAVQLMVDYFFLSSDAPRVEAQAHPENRASQRVLEKARFQRERTIRKCFYSRGVWQDTARFRILKKEWKETGILKRILARAPYPEGGLD
jgi:predicted acetyltransferase